MIKTTLVILTLISTPVLADKPYFDMGSPGIIARAGWNPSNHVETAGIVIEAESIICDKYKICYNPYVAYISDVPAIGLDVVYKPLKNNTGGIRLSAGMSAFDEPLNGIDKTVPHVGVSYQIYIGKNHAFMISADAFLFDDTVAQMYGLGVHFR